jgi:hypothetical protein
VLCKLRYRAPDQRVFSQQLLLMQSGGGTGLGSIPAANASSQGAVPPLESDTPDLDGITVEIGDSAGVGPPGNQANASRPIRPRPVWRPDR